MRNNLKAFGKLLGTVLGAFGIGAATEKILEAKRRKMVIKDTLNKANNKGREVNDEKDY